MMIKLLKRLLKDLSVSLVGILLVILCLLIVAGFVLFGFARMPGKTHAVVSSLGKYTDKTFYTCGGFQDFTDYAKYSFQSVDSKKLEDNAYFQPVSTGNMDTLLAFILDFEGWIGVHEGSELAANYDFQRDHIDPEDYFFLQGDLDSYNLYFLDSQTNMLYYFHNNI